MSRRQSVWPAFLIGVLVATACSRETSVSSMTDSQARAVLVGIEQDIALTLPGRALQSVGEPRAVGCDSSLVDDPDTTRAIYTRWRVAPVPEAMEVGPLFDDLIASMPAQGWQVVIDARRARDPEVSFERRDDGFTIGYIYAADGRMTVSASSPCVVPDDPPQ